MSDDNMGTICSALQPIVVEIFKEKIGICDEEIELLEVNSGKPSWEEKNKLMIGDRMKLKIPFAGQYLYWEVVFNCSVPEYPPDFDLNDDSFLNEISIDAMEENVPSLVNWDLKDKKALFNVILELRVLYLKYQVEIMDMDFNHCAIQYASVLEKAKINSNNIEVLVYGNKVFFLIHLNVDLSKFDLSKEEHCYKVALATCFSPYMTSPHLIMTPDFEELIACNVHVPLFEKNSEDNCLGDYVLNLIDKIEDEITATLLSRESKRKQFLFELLDRFGINNVINYDIMKHTHANMLLSTNGFYFLLRVEIPKEFPSKSPTYRLQSVYNLDEGLPFVQKITSVPFSASWSVTYMINKLCRYLEASDELTKFQENSLKLFKLPVKKY